MNVSTRRDRIHALLNSEVAAGLKQGLLLGAAVLALIVPQGTQRTASNLPAPGALVARGQPLPPGTAAAGLRKVDFGGEPASADAQAVAQWVVGSGDNGQRPFVIIDKRQAHVFVFHPEGRLIGATPVLLGYAAGDDTVPGIGQRPIAEVRPEERTTPAGRFVGERGLNSNHEDIVWVDYDAAVSMHRVRPNDPKERRLERLASPTVDDNRISYGCINMPVAFFDKVLWPVFQQQRGIVYVLPEVKALGEVFPALAGQDAARSASPKSTAAVVTPKQTQAKA